MKLLELTVLICLLSLAACSDGAETPIPVAAATAQGSLTPTPVLLRKTPTQPRPTPTFTPKATRDSGKPLIIFNRSGGFAGVSEEWQIFADGRVIDNTGRELQVSAAAIDQLWVYIKHSGFFALAEAYLPKDPCCDRFTYVITVRYGESEHTVTTMDQTPGAPGQLLDVIQAINALLVDAGR